MKLRKDSKLEIEIQFTSGNVLNVASNEFKKGELQEWIKDRILDENGDVTDVVVLSKASFFTNKIDAIVEV